MCELNNKNKLMDNEIKEKLDDYAVASISNLKKRKKLLKKNKYL